MWLVLSLLSCSVYRPLPIDQVCNDALTAYAAGLRQCTDDLDLINKRYEQMRDTHTCRAGEFIGEGFVGELSSEVDIDLAFSLEGGDTDAQGPTAIQVNDAYACPRAVSSVPCERLLQVDPTTTWLQQLDPVCALLFEPDPSAERWKRPGRDDPDPTDTDTETDTGFKVPKPKCDRRGVPEPRNVHEVTSDGTYLYHDDVDAIGATTELISWRFQATAGVGDYAMNQQQIHQCTNCLLGCTGWPGTAVDRDWSKCNRFYMGVGGTVRITQNDNTSGGTFAGEYVDVVLREATYSNGGSTDVQDGKTWCINHSWSQTIP